MQNDDLLVGLDIGTTEIRCLVGRHLVIDEESHFQILGFGHAPNQGMQGGVISICDEVSRNISNAIQQAELNADCSISEATINVNGKYIKAIPCESSIRVASTKKLITELEYNLVEDQARQSIIKPGRQLVQFFANSFQIDKSEHTTDPIGYVAETLGIKALGVTTSDLHVETMFRACEEADIAINDFSISSMAIAHATYKAEDWQSGVVIIDIGYSTTNLIAIRDNKIDYVEIFKFGGFNVTQDIAIILKTDLETAEFLKIHHAKLNHNVQGTKTVKFEGKAINFSPRLLSQVVTTRWQEICQIIARNLQQRDYEYISGGIILAGGASMTTGLDKLLQSYLDVYTRSGKLINFSGLTNLIATDQRYLTVAGLMILDLGLQTKFDTDAQSDSNKKNKFFDIFRKKI